MTRWKLFGDCTHNMYLKIDALYISYALLLTDLACYDVVKYHFLFKEQHNGISSQIGGRRRATSNMSSYLHLEVEQGEGQGNK